MRIEVSGKVSAPQYQMTSHANHVLNADQCVFVAARGPIGRGSIVLDNQRRLRWNIQVLNDALNGAVEG